MKSPQILSKTDRTSWSRIAMVLNFYYPCIKWQLWSFPLLSVIVFALSEIFTPHDHLILYSMSSSLLSLAMTFAPLAFSSIRGRELQAMLPALGLEKCVAILGWCLICVPVLLEAPNQLLSLIVRGQDLYSYTLSGLDTEVFPIVVRYAPEFGIIGVFSSLAMMLNCTWGVFGAKRHPALWGLLGVVLFYVACTFLSMVISFGAGIYLGIQAGLSGGPMPELDPLEVTDRLIKGILYVFVPFCGFYVIFALVKCCRAISRQQF